jgi:hypothetical protein
VHLSAPVTIAEGAIQNTTNIDGPEPVAMTVTKTVTRGSAGIERVEERHEPEATARRVHRRKKGTA